MAAADHMMKVMKIIYISSVYVLPDQQSIAEEFRDLCDNSENKFDNKVSVLEVISRESTIKEEIIMPVSSKIPYMMKSLFLRNMEAENLKELSKKYYRQETYANIPAPCVNSKNWNGNLLSSLRMSDTNLRKLELLNLKGTYAATITILATNDQNKFMQDRRMSSLPRRMKQLVKI